MSHILNKKFMQRTIAINGILKSKPMSSVLGIRTVSRLFEPCSKTVVNITTVEINFREQANSVVFMNSEIVQSGIVRSRWGTHRCSSSLEPKSISELKNVIFHHQQVLSIFKLAKVDVFRIHNLFSERRVFKEFEDFR